MHSSSYSIFAFQIRDLNNELFHWPYSDKKKKEVDNFFLCNKYIGCGHAIKKEFFDKVGGYTKDMFFGFEESELVMKSFAVDGLPVQYNGKIIIVHRVTQTTRLIESKRFYYKVRNRLFIIRELAPFGGGPYFLLYLVVYFVRSLQYRLVGAYFKGVKDAMGKKINKRMRMSVGAFIKYLKYGI
jgi:GT2 family glycosyltransferase